MRTQLIFNQSIKINLKCKEIFIFNNFHLIIFLCVQIGGQQIKILFLRKFFSQGLSKYFEL